MDRRHFVLSTFGLFVAGCQEATKTTRLPDPVWPSVRPAPTISKPVYVPPAEPVRPRVVAQPKPAPKPAFDTSLGSPANPIARSKWSGGGPNLSNINRMGGINRITMHHDGFPFATTFTDYNSAAARMEHYRRGHRGRGWADIGYHYVLDPGGRLWEARDIQYQGAHVKDHNEHNLGIMIMGNYNLQYPTDVQLTALRDAVSYFRRKYNVSQRAIFTHRELGPTSCPGNNMQPKIASMRSAGQFA